MDEAVFAVVIAISSDLEFTDGRHQLVAAKSRCLSKVVSRVILATASSNEALGLLNKGFVELCDYAPYWLMRIKSK